MSKAQEVKLSMCKITHNGYAMEDGTVIPFSGLNIADISVKHINELNSYSATAWDVVLMRNSNEGLKDLIQDLKNTTCDCLPDDKKINRLIDIRLNSLPKKILSKGEKISDGLTKFIVLMLAISQIYIMFFKG